MIALLLTCEEVTGAPIPPRLLRSSKYAFPSLPSATTRLEGVAPGTSTSNGPDPPRSVSDSSSDCQFAGAQKSLGCSVKIGPGWKRISASPPRHGSPGFVKVLPVATNGLFPSLATPPILHIPPPNHPVAQAVTLPVLF